MQMIFVDHFIVVDISAVLEFDSCFSQNIGCISGFSGISENVLCYLTKHCD